ncbi:hypothetical protein U9M48_031734 [Paspalum notatum var. saurae]|uniref:Uncharacterized protein n=1 Tax=Paspalum notatum var. saurae TaxID=547442 RepID=A0AAQ3U6E4_PASNO
MWSAGLHDLQVVMAVAFNPAIKSQPGEIFSFGAFTTIVDKRGNAHPVHALLTPMAPCAPPQPVPSLPKPEQIRSTT